MPESRKAGAVESIRPKLTLRGRTFAWGSRTFVMGIINVTPDSFSGDGVAGDVDAALVRAHAMERAGADIIDVGGESTRPGHVPVSEEEESARVLPMIAALRSALDIPISIDTFKPAVAARAVELGADLINCVWGAHPGIAEAAAAKGVPLVVMHNRASADYAGDVVDEVIASLERAACDVLAAGVPPAHIIVDPGIGFGKTAEHNVEILRRLADFRRRLPYPLLVGTSRKSFIGKITGLPVEQRAFGTAASVALAIAAGADIIRVHDVEAMVAVAQVADAICRGAAKSDA
ncbi:MAG TPA: dihydropteroate synthase [Candidatus Eremiobacteraceae bacterium]|nr:dihydropteroate synthase [Candidatus Eremiobacteraceae bacterium]